MRQKIENYEIAFGGEQGEGLLTFDLADVKDFPCDEDGEALTDPTALRLHADHIEVDFGPGFGLDFIQLPSELHARLRPLRGIWVAGLQGAEIKVAEELDIETV